MNRIIIGYSTEGSTDVRFLQSIIERTFVEVGFECSSQIEVMTPVVYIKKSKGDTFPNQILHSSKEAFENGVMAFCVHSDADAENDAVVFDKINKAFDKVYTEEDKNICNNLIAIIPIQMSEAWMLADKQLLKDEIGTTLEDFQLLINKAPEAFTDPKTTIKEAIRIARKDFPKRRRGSLTIAELYQPIGQKIEIEKLNALSSYRKFKEGVRDAYRKLNYLQ